MMTGPKLRRPLFILLFALYAIYLAYLPLQDKPYSRRDPLQAAGFWRASNPADFFNKMARYGLANPSPKRPLELRLLHSISFDFNLIRSVERRKRAFCDMLVPQVLLMNRTVLQQRQRYLELCDKIPEESLSDTVAVARLLNRREWKLLQQLQLQYGTTRHDWLLDRIQPIPPSLVLAQAAVESAWGTSRFAREGNNLFGIWTWEEEGLLPQSRRAGKQHRVARFPTILEGVERYFELLNTLPAYADFRRQRNQKIDPRLLAASLQNYSAKGSAYSKLLKNVIRHNQLTRYDSLHLIGD
ncbi:glucosaminidase domain-containing protein [bacterium]|nr:glucosaminidase domain-containing protein [bacterium]